MSAPYYNLLDKTSKALALYLRSQLSTAKVYPAKRALEKEPPCTICAAETAVPEIHWSGRYIVDCSITVVTVLASAPPETEDGSDASVSEAETLVASVFDALHIGDYGEGRTLADTISDQVDDFTCFIVKHDSISQEYEDNVCRDILRLKLVCAPSDIE